MNRVMATRSVSLQEERTATTRARILDAVAELIIEEHPATLSVPAVAERAGVSLRTVYRYFPTKQALIDGIADLGNDQTAAQFPSDAVTFADMREYIPHLWAEVQSTRGLIKAQHATPLGQEVAKSRAERRIRIIQRVMGDEGVELPPDDHRRLVALIALLTSRETLFELTDVLDLSVDEAANVAVWALEVIVEAAKRTKEVGQ